MKIKNKVVLITLLAGALATPFAFAAGPVAVVKDTASHINHGMHKAARHTGHGVRKSWRHAKHGARKHAHHIKHGVKRVMH